MSSKTLKKGVVKNINRETLQIAILGPIGEKGYYLEKKVSLHCLQIPDEAKSQVIDYLIERLPGKEVRFDDYGLDSGVAADIFLDDEYINLDLVKKGLAKVSKTSKPSKYFEDLIAALQKAKDQGEGIFKELSKEEKKALREKEKGDKDEKKEGVGWKGTGWIEEFNYELDFKLYLKKLDKVITTTFLGITIPVVGKEHMMNFRNWVSKHILQRPFELKIEMISEGKFKILDQSVSSKTSPLHKLLTQGWAKLENDASNVLESTTYTVLRTLQEEAMAAKLRIWVNFEGKIKNRVELPAESEFEARVFEVISGDSLSVLKNNSEQPMKICLSHIRAPLMGGKSEDPKPFAWEAKDTLRKLLIGKKVKVKIDQIRKIEKENAPTLELTMATVVLEDGKNPAVEILEKGLAQFNAPRPGDAVSPFLQDLSKAAEKGEKSKKGIYSKDKGLKNYWDITKPENKKRIKEIGIENYKNKGEESGVVEVVLNASCVKMRFDAANCLFAFALEGIRSLEKNPNMPGYEKWANKASDYTKSKLLQREVKFEVEAIDKVGRVHGMLLLNGKDFALELLSKGLAYVSIHGGKSFRTEEYKQAEQAAKSKNIGFWADGLNPNQNDQEEILEKSIELVCSCPEIISPTNFYLRMTEQAEALEREIEKIKQMKPAAEPLLPNTILLGFFEGKFYRCKILRKDQKGYLVLFIDYGNEEVVDITHLRQCPQNLIETQPFAFKAALEGLVYPPSGSEYDDEIFDYMSNFLQDDTKLRVSIRARRFGTSYCIISKNGLIGGSLNVKLLERGLAALDPNLKNVEHEFAEAAAQGSVENPELISMINNMDE